MDFGNVGNAVIVLSLIITAALLLIMACFKHLINDQKKRRGLKK